jgi:hypothetical protein
LIRIDNNGRNWRQPPFRDKPALPEPDGHGNPNASGATLCLPAAPRFSAAPAHTALSPVHPTRSAPCDSGRTAHRLKHGGTFLVVPAAAPDAGAKLSRNWLFTSPRLRRNTVAAVAHHGSLLSRHRTAGAADGPLCLDAGQVRRWTSEAEAREPQRPPFLEVFSGHGKTLYYFGVKHAYGADSVVAREACLWLDALAPQSLIVEVGPDSRKLDRLEKYARDGFRTESENLVLTHHAWQCAPSMPVVLGDMTQSELCRVLHAAGYSHRDILGERVLHYAIRDHGNGWLTGARLDAAVQAHLETALPGLIPDDERFASLADFTAWYDQRNTAEPLLRWTDRTQSIPPSDADGASFFARLKATKVHVRSLHLLHAVQEAFDQHDVVMIACGASHLTDLRPALQAQMKATPIVSYAREAAREEAARRTRVGNG